MARLLAVIRRWRGRRSRIRGGSLTSRYVLARMVPCVGLPMDSVLRQFARGLLFYMGIDRAWLSPGFPNKTEAIASFPFCH